MAVTINRETNIIIDRDTGIVLSRGGDPITIVVGADGAPGVGVPAGGTTGQVLSKSSDTDYDTGWVFGGVNMVSRTGSWSYNSTAGAVPGNKGFTADSAIPASISWLRFDDTDNNNTDHTQFIVLLMTAGSKILLQTAADSTQWAVFTLTGAPTDAGGYVEVPVLLTDQSGTWPPANNVAALVDFITSAGGGGGLPEAPIDGTLYGRRNASWAQINGVLPPDGATGQVLAKQSFASWDVGWEDVGNARIYVGTSRPDPVDYDLWYETDYDQLEVTTTGATFTPRIWLAAGSTATISWTDEQGTVLGTGTAPTINFGTSATRLVRMDVSAPEDVEVINLGYNNADDAGPFQIGDEYDWPPAGLDNEQIHVTGVSGVWRYPNLIAFMAASRDAADGNRLTGHLDLHGLTSLTHVEVFYAKITSVDLTGCTSLIRVCFEQNRLSYLDMNASRTTLRDLRGARQEGLEMAPIAGDGTFSALYHYCVQGQSVTNNYTPLQLPAIEEYWVYNSNIDGTWYVPRLPGDHRVYNSGITALEFQNADDTTPGFQLRARDNQILSVVNIENGIRFNRYDFTSGNIPSSVVDDLLIGIESYGTSGNYIYLNGNSPRTTASNAAYDALVGRGWDVQVGQPDLIPPGPVTGLNATPGASSVTLAWSNPTDDDLAGIVVRYATGPTAPTTITDGTGFPVTGTPTSVLVTGLSSSTQYSFSVFAQDDSLNTSTGASVTTTTEAPDLTPPGPVTGLAASPGGNEITLSWTNPVDADLTHIVVRRALGAVAPATINDGTEVAVTGTPTSVTDTGLNESTQYSYGVWAQDDSLNTSIRAAVTAATTGGAVLLWEDTFERPDADGVTGVGNNWSSTNGESGINIRSNQLDRVTDSDYNQELRVHGSAVSSQINMACEIDIEDAYVTSFIAVLMRCAATGRGAGAWVDGVRFFCGNPANDYSDFAIGNARDYNTEDRTLTQVNPVPASWGNNGVNTLRGELRGTEARMILNGTHVATANVGALSNQPYDNGDTDVSFGIGGDTRNGGGTRINAIRVYQI